MDGLFGVHFFGALAGSLPGLSAALNFLPTFFGMPSVLLPAAAARMARRCASLTGGTGASLLLFVEFTDVERPDRVLHQGAARRVVPVHATGAAAPGLRGCSPVAGNRMAFFIGHPEIQYSAD